MVENRFYVYTLLDPRKPGNFKYGEFAFNYEPFYVGKGTGFRMTDHVCPSELKRDRNLFKKRKIIKIIREVKYPAAVIP